MALADSDLLIVQRPSNRLHYKIKVGDFLPGDPLPIGTEEGQVLTWNGTEWVALTPADELPPGTKVGQLLTWNGTEWIAADDRLPDGTDSGELLSWNGTNWIAVNSIDGGTY
nr:hypothetical protein 75 [Pelagibacteraceae bacterium]